MNSFGNVGYLIYIYNDADVFILVTITESNVLMSVKLSSTAFKSYS